MLVFAATSSIQQPEMSVPAITLGFMKDQLPAGFNRLLRMQHLVFSRKQALRAGFTQDAVGARVRRGTWRRLYPGVYTTLTGEPGRSARLWAALLYAGRGAVLSHETAAQLHGLPDKAANVIHVTIPAERRVIEAPSIRIHRSARVFEAALPDADPPRTRIEETVLDLAEAAANFDDVCDWVTRAISNDLTNEIKLLAAMKARGKLRWRLELGELIAAAAEGDHSVLEYRYTRDVERPHGLPAPDRQVPFKDLGKRRGRRDRVYTKYGVIVELDGRLGHLAEKVRKDNARDRAAAAGGKQSLRYGWHEVRYEQCDTAVEVAKVLRNNGWKGSPRPCSVYCRVQYDFPS
jgi:AbiEi antitoxin C-terminal domain